jgi:hypothetical protein
MKWFRRHIKTGSRLALFALAVQFALSFGHHHVNAAPATPAMQIGLTDADLSYVDGFVAAEAAGQTVRQQPASPDTDHHPADACAICAVMALGSNLLFAHPPLLLLPQAVELLYLVTDAEFAHLNFGRSAFQSRAPPAS